MLKRITKFVLERRKTVQTPRQQFVENDDTTDLTSASESPPGELASQPVWAKARVWTLSTSTTVARNQVGID
jgi:hypothetical protein